MLFKTYIPKYFCREYVETKGSSVQLAMFMSVVLGLKPLMDDWIPTNKLKEFKKICKNLGLKIREDVIFLNTAKENIPDNILGKEYLTTTSAYGYPVDSRKDGQIHIFISKDKKLLRRGMWYPVIIKDRVIFQPRADILKYGYVLGYPDCCIKFFRKYNDWLRYSNLYEAYVNTKGVPSFLCNPFLKDTPFSYIYHMPCSYSCQETIKLAGKLRLEINKREPGYVKLADEYLQMPFLVFYEKKYYCFKGEIKNNLLKYEKVYFSSPTQSNDMYGEFLKNADSFKLHGRSIILYRGKKIFKVTDIPLRNFASEYPFVIKLK